MSAAELIAEANSLREQGRDSDAEPLWLKAYEETNNPIIAYNLGCCVKDRMKEAEDARIAFGWFSTAILDEKTPAEIRAAALVNAGLLAEKFDEYDWAFGAYQRAMMIEPGNSQAMNNIATHLRDRGDFREAAAMLDEAIAINPGSAEAAFNGGMLNLLLGDFARGWEQYDARWDVKKFASDKFVSERPRWNGEPLDGKTILLTMEQGFGDAIQFIRYAREIKDRYDDCKVWFYGHAALVGLFQHVVGLDNAFAVRETEDYDYHIPLLSVPRVMVTRLKTVPNRIPYIMPRDLPAFVKDPAGFGDEPRRIGIVWAGSPTHGKDKDRSIEPELFQPIVDASNALFYSLQVGPRAHEVSRLNGVIDLAWEIGLSWLETASYIKGLDFVITVDTAVAHLAGALGVPVWVLIPSSPDWRWMLNREDSPWYPTMRLFRQETRGDWETPIQRICEAL